MRFLFPVLFMILTAGFYTGCIDEDFSVNPEHKLYFSNDTVRFDTVFTTIGSSTSQLMVYNMHNKALRIDAVALLNAGKSGFRVNVDGRKGDRFENLEISKNDSLYIFVEVTVDPVETDYPERREDILEFTLNGITQRVILEAYGQDAWMWRAKTITKDTTLTRDKPFLIYDSLVVERGAKLTLEAGTRLFFHDKGRLILDGSLTANGALNQPVILRGDRTDKLFHNLPYDQVPGQWGGIEVRSGSFENRLTHTHIRNTTFGIQIDSTGSEAVKLQMESCILKNSKEELLQATNARMEVANCEFSNAAGALVSLKGGYAQFTHCTFANHYPFGVITEATLYLSNYFRNNQGEIRPMALQRADFNNCIIWGKRQVEVNLDEYQKVNEEAAFAHLFDHCLIRARGEDDENFINSVWDQDPLFLKVNEKEYLFDLRIDSLSAARNAGNPIHGQRYPTDLNGNPRTIEAPDLGAYQWVGQE